MSKTTDYFDAPAWNVRPHFSKISEHNERYKYYRGTVLTEFGIVEVYSEVDNFSTVCVVIDGYCHTRMWHYGFAPQTLVTLAKRFAKEKSNANIS